MFSRCRGERLNLWIVEPFFGGVRSQHLHLRAGWIHPRVETLVARSLEILSWFRDEQFVALWLQRALKLQGSHRHYFGCEYMNVYTVYIYIYKVWHPLQVTVMVTATGRGPHPAMYIIYIIIILYTYKRQFINQHLFSDFCHLNLL